MNQQVHDLDRKWIWKHRNWKDFFGDTELHSELQELDTSPSKETLHEAIGYMSHHLTSENQCTCLENQCTCFENQCT